MRWLERIAWFRAHLAMLQETRDARQDWTELEGNPMPGWAAYELEGMHKLVNEERVKEGLEPVTLRQVREVEAMAQGQCDYSHKFALYCAELAVGAEKTGVIQP